MKHQLHFTPHIRLLPETPSANEEWFQSYLKQQLHFFNYSIPMYNFCLKRQETPSKDNKIKKSTQWSSDIIWLRLRSNFKFKTIIALLNIEQPTGKTVN